MKEFQNILFPVDFSPSCESTVPYVAEMVRSFHAKLTLLHVVEIPFYWYANVPPGPIDVWNSLEEAIKIGQQDLTNFGCRHFSDLAKLTPVEAICDRGDPGFAILAHAAKHGAELIMMPTQGHTPFRSFLLGSTVARVLHRAACPVWTGAHLEKAAAAEHAGIKNILCALDLERESVHVIESAVALAQKLSAELRLVHCVAVPEGGKPEDFASQFDRFLAGIAREELDRIQAEAGTNYEVVLEGGHISKVVRNSAIRLGTDLVVIGRGHVQSPLSRLRTNAYAIIRDSPCPVLSV